MEACHPVLFFEFDPSFSPGAEKGEALQAMEALTEAGYRHYVIYDNFGNFLISFSDAPLEKFKDLFSFLEQSRTGGGGVLYLDVCCFADQDRDIFQQLVSVERTPSG